MIFQDLTKDNKVPQLPRSRVEDKPSYFKLNFDFKHTGAEVIGIATLRTPSKKIAAIVSGTKAVKIFDLLVKKLELQLSESELPALYRYLALH